MAFGPPESEEFFGGGDAPTDRVTGVGLFIANEGNFMYGNASLSYYDPASKRVENQIFHLANAYDPGDVAQSMTIRNGIGRGR